MDDPYGRNLKNFNDPARGGLSPAEIRLCEAVRLGIECRADLDDADWRRRTDEAEKGGHRNPDSSAICLREALPGSVVRADFLRFLLLGGDKSCPVHEKGVQLAGAWITGLLDLDECEVTSALRLDNCVLNSGIRLTDASLETFELNGCSVEQIPRNRIANAPAGLAIVGDRMHATGSVCIRRGARVNGLLRLQAADIAGDLDLSGSAFTGAGGDSIDLNGIEIKGDLELNSFYDARLPALGEPRRILCELKIWDRVILDNASVGMRFRAIGATITFTDGSCTCRKPVLSCVGMTVKGGFFFHHSKIAGVSLLGAKVGTLVDERESWETGKDRHRFDGFVYERIADESREVDRSLWLRWQRPLDLGRSYKNAASRHRHLWQRLLRPWPDTCRPVKKAERGLRRQPRDQVAKALDSVGERRAARILRIEGEWLAVFAGGWWKRPDIFAFRLGYHALCGSGYGYPRLFGITFAVWLFGSCAANTLILKEGFYPGNQALAASHSYVCSKNSATFEGVFPIGKCKSTGQPYPVLNPLLYSLDNLAALIDLNQKKAWWAKSVGWAYWVLTVEYFYGIFATSALLGLLASYIVRKPV